MVISILGCGWYGLALGEALVKEGMTVKGSTTSAGKMPVLAAGGIEPYLLQVTPADENLSSDFFRCDVLVISIPPGFRKGGAADYLPKIQAIIRAIERHGIKKVIYTSSTGVYGDHNSKVDDLTAPAPDTEAGQILLEAERLLSGQPLFSTSILRFGGLIGPGRHPGRFFAGKKEIPNGRAPVNLVHLSDCVGISLAIIKQDAFGYLFNAVSPQHPLKGDFYVQAATRAGLPIPEFIDELNQWKIVNSVNLALLHYAFESDSLTGQL